MYIYRGISHSIHQYVQLCLQKASLIRFIEARYARSPQCRSGFLVEEPPACSLDKQVCPLQWLWQTFVANGWWSQPSQCQRAPSPLVCNSDWVPPSLTVLIYPLVGGWEGNVDSFLSHLFLADSILNHSLLSHMIGEVIEPSSHLW